MGQGMRDRKRNRRIIGMLMVLCILFSGCQTNIPSVPTDVSSVSTVSSTTSSSTIVSTTKTTAPTTSTVVAATTTTVSTAATRDTTQTTWTPPVTTKTTVVTTVALTTAKPQTTTTADRGKVVTVSVGYVSQSGFPTGCESASATMLLRFWDVDMTVSRFVDRYLEKGEITRVGDRLYAPHPDEAFVGDPRSEQAYGCYAPVIVRAIQSCLPETLRVVNESGTSLSELCKTYIDNGMPVMIWATIDMKPARKGDTWIVKPGGEEYQWIAGEHCLVLVGYDQRQYYLLDPYDDQGLVSYPRATVEARYAELGRQAVGIGKLPISTGGTTTTATTITSTTTITTTTETVPSTEPSVTTTSSTEAITTQTTLPPEMEPDQGT